MTTQTLRPLVDEYTGPPKRQFLEESWFRRDIEACFRPRWLLAGHVDQLDRPEEGHGYVTFSLGAEEVFIRRDEDGRVRAYHNACPHRGAQLCVGAAGTTPSKRVVCPYHAWTYSVSDGALLSARHMHEDFDPGNLRLKPAHAEEWMGLLFVCLSEQTPPPFSEYIREVTLGGYDLASMKLAAVKTHDIEANWKVVVENNLECYHCVVIHPELSKVMDWSEVGDSDFEGHMSERANGVEVIQPPAVPAAFTIDNERICSIPAPRTDGEAEPPSYPLFWEPGYHLVASRDLCWIFSPKPVAPGRTELTQYFLVDRDAVEGRDYDLDVLKRFWDTTMLQDRDICESVQRGMEMPAYEPGPLNRVYQTGQAGFYAWYTEQIGRG